MGIKISQLPETTVVNSDDVLPIVHNGSTMKVKSNLLGNNYEKTNITTLTGGASINSTYWRNRLVREGKICHLELGVIPNSTSLITILTLPAGYYSTGNTATIGLIMRDSAIGKAVITNNGQIQIQVPSSSGSTWSLNMTWTID